MVREEVDVAVILGNSIRNVEQLAKNEGVKISLDVPSEVLTVYADKRSATQIVYNILSNAIKFTPTGGEIDISAAATGEGTEIKIGDTGVGISADKLPTITEPFSQMHSDPHLTQQGTGLGLSIVKSLVEANRGVLKIESELGKGTTVTVAFPLNDIDSEESHQT